MSSRRDAEFTEFVGARLPSLRRLALLLCQDSAAADDVVQSAITKLYVHWNRARAADHVDAYARKIVVREFLRERRSGWARRELMPGTLPERPAAAAADQDAALDLRAAVAALPPGQRAVLVLRFYCDLSIDQAAAELGCSPGNIKSQTARALASLRRTLGPPAPPPLSPGPEPVRPRRAWAAGPHGEVTDHG